MSLFRRGLGSLAAGLLPRTGSPACPPAGSLRSAAALPALLGPAPTREGSSSPPALPAHRPGTAFTRPTTPCFFGARALSTSVPSAAGPRRPTLEEADAMCSDPSEYSNELLIQLARVGDIGAREERLVREIMRTDRVSWDEAQPRLQELRRANAQSRFLLAAPYYAGLSIGAIAAVACFPLTFELHSVTAFNELFVTTDVPEERDLETWLEVGSWAWNWMEPPLGTMSFFLLCLQLIRNQMNNLGIQPYTSFVKDWRAMRLVRFYPQYSAGILIEFSETTPLHVGQHAITFQGTQDTAAVGAK